MRDRFFAQGRPIWIALMWFDARPGNRWLHAVTQGLDEARTSRSDARTS